MLSYGIDGPLGRPGSGRVNFIALTTVLWREFHHTLFRAKDDQLKIMVVKIKPRHRPNLEACYLGRYSLYRGFQRANCLSRRNFGLDIQNEQEFPRHDFDMADSSEPVSFDSFSSVS